MFRFGEECSTHGENEITARNLKQAILLYKTSRLFPESDVPHKYVKDSDYCSHRNRYICTFKVADPKIPIYTFKDNKRLKSGYKKIKVGELSLSECVNFDFNSIYPERKRLPFEGPVENSTSLIPTAAKAIIGKNVKLLTKVDMRQAMDKIQDKVRDLEIMKSELSEAMELMRKEIREKEKMIHLIETYIGTNEEVYTLATGTCAAEDSHLYLYQQVLFMDEEIGIWEKGGLDYEDINKFDEWIKKNYTKFLHYEKSICVFIVRRHEKNYSDNAMINAILNEDNFRAYFLMRNGQNLYRIYSSIPVGHTLFPRKDELDKLFNEYKDKDYSNYIDPTPEEMKEIKEQELKEKLKDYYQKYFYGLVAIQGVIDRTNLLGAIDIKKVNFMNMSTWDSDLVHLIRDAERDYWISDGHPSWYDFCKKNREGISQGTRIVLTLDEFSRYSRDSDQEWRTYPFRQFDWPNHYTLYTVEEVPDKDKRVYHDWRFLFRYLPSNTYVFRADPYNDGPPKRRVPFRVYSDEVLNFDTITSEDCRYYLYNRFERENYLRILPILHYMMELKEKEEKLEGNFIKFIQGKLPDTDKECIYKAVRWWKLKNKWKRELTKDDAKAVRMVLKRIKCPTYFDIKEKK